MEENKFRYCKLLLTDHNNNSKIFVSEKISTTLEIIINLFT